MCDHASYFNILKPLDKDNLDILKNVDYKK